MKGSWPPTIQTGDVCDGSNGRVDTRQQEQLSRSVVEVHGADRGQRGRHETLHTGGNFILTCLKGKYSGFLWPQRWWCALPGRQIGHYNVNQRRPYTLIYH